jgi:2-polyprenyl-3-methyl-5-hydroxy-6-metoxy-1,4-benzoquinol methylase
MLNRFKRRLQDPYDYLLFRVEALRLGLQERKHTSQTGAAVPVPPPLLRHRVHGGFDLEDYLRVGRICAQSLRDLLGSVGRDPSSFRTILDFGCGSGRTLRAFDDLPDSCQLHGTDIDRQAIDWCKRHLDRASWSANNPWPPLAYAGQTFDFIYAISVFTHLDEEMQFAWLEELKRVSKPDAVLILSVHGESHQSHLSAEQKAVIAEKGFLFVRDLTGGYKRAGLPDFYQITCHTRAYIEDRWSRFFKVIGYVECGMAGYHDAVILQNR